MENLEAQGYICYLPLIAIEKIQRGKIVRVVEALFPRYLFIQLDTAYSSQSWAPIRSTVGVSRLVTFGGQPAKVDHEIIHAVRQGDVNRSNVAQAVFTAGDHVQILTGAFAGISGVYQMPNGEGRAMLLIEILSQSVKISVPNAGIGKQS